MTLLNEAGTASVTQPITLYNVPVKDGNFSAEVEFGIDLSLAPALKLKTEVGQNNSGFSSLSEPIRFDPKAALAGICWDTTGNVVAAGEFLGSTNNVPLILKANNASVQRIAGGLADDSSNSVAGSPGNTVDSNFRGQTVAGGGNSTTTCVSSGFGSTCQNSAAGNYATVGGGSGNRVVGNYSTVAGGLNNVAKTGTSTVSGGASNLASAGNSTISGGSTNIASGLSSTVGGGGGNCAGGDYSWVGGTEATTRPGNEPNDGACVLDSGDANGDEGTFVWADKQFVKFISTGPNQFLVRAGGGMGLNTARLGQAADLRLSELVIRNGVTGDNTDISLMNDTDRGYNMVSVPNGVNAGTFVIGEVDARAANVGFTNRLLISPNGDFTVTAGAFKPGGGAWSVASDARLKKEVSTLQGSLDRLLALHGVNFSYRDDAPTSLTAPGVQIGFIAQEVEKVFPQWIAERDGYKTIGIRGFEALTVEALRDLRGESAVIDAAQSAEIEKLRAENAALQVRLDRLEAMLAR